MRSSLASFGDLPRGLGDRDAVVPEDEVPEFVGQRAVAGRQALLNQEDVMVAVLTPLAGDARTATRPW